jgi:flagellin-like protein
MPMLVASKRGVSPLIATILLIAFAVALGSVIMNWGLNLSAQNSDDPCQRIRLELKPVANAEACYGNIGAQGYVNFILENTGNSDISGVSIWLTGQKKTELIDLVVSIPRKTTFERSNKETSFDFNAIGNINQIQFIPKVQSGEKTSICTRQAIEPKTVTFC